MPDLDLRMSVSSRASEAASPRAIIYDAAERKRLHTLTGKQPAIQDPGVRVESISAPTVDEAREKAHARIKELTSVKFWTIEDFRDHRPPGKRNASGFHNVASATGGAASANRNVQLWRAQVYGDVKGALFPSNKLEWRSDVDQDPEKCAQALADYMNGQAAPAAPTPAAYPATSIDMGGAKAYPKAAAAAPVARSAAKQKEHKGPTDLYDIEVYVTHDPAYTICRKIGVTARGDDRYLSMLTTFPCQSIRPVAAARAFPTRKRAEAAANRRYAQMEKDPTYVRLGKSECFVLREKIKVIV